MEAPPDRAYELGSGPLIHRRFPQTRASLPHLRLCRTPTPVRELESLRGAVDGSRALWLKDDAFSATPWGGNKPRKLEWVLADARARGRGTILTFGALGTNHGLATALYARECGLRCALALVDQPVDEHVRRQLGRIRATEATVHLTRSTPRTVLSLPYLLARHSQARSPRLPYWLPPGGSSAVGTLGFVEAALELGAQVERGELPEPAEIVVALGSGGTAAGLLAGLRLAGLRTRVRAVLVNDHLRLSERSVARLARRTLRLLGARGADVDRVSLDRAGLTLLTGFLGAGYGHPTPEAMRARRLAWETEGLSLDPVYTAKAAAAAIADAGQTDGRGPLLLWNTSSGLPGGSEGAAGESARETG